MKSLDKRIDSAMGCIVGAAVGDALGAPLEFLTPKKEEEYITEMEGGGVLKWNPGDITDDTTMILSVCEMYREKGGYHQPTLVRKWLEWKNTGPKDIGAWTSNALSKWSHYIRAKRSESIDSAGKIEGLQLPEFNVSDVTHPVVQLWNAAGRNDAGNGGLMRCMPTAVFEPFLQGRIEQASRICMDTHPDPRCIESCVLLVEMLHEIIENDLTQLDGEGKKHLIINMTDKLSNQIVQDEEFLGEITDILGCGGENITNGGYTVDTFISAYSGFEASKDFESGLISIVNQGNDADTTGAVAGALLGAYYGYSAIPDRWLGTLCCTEKLLEHVQYMYSRKIKLWKENGGTTSFRG